MCYERRDEEFAKVCRERDELKRELEELREKLDAAIDGNVNLRIRMEKVQEERDYLYDLVEGSCTACKHNGVPEWPCHRCGDDEDLWEYGREW